MDELITLTPLRQTLAVQALLEQAQLLKMLRQHLSRHCAGDEIEFAARGVIRRSLELGDAARAAIGWDSDLDDQQLIKLVDCPPVELPGGPG